MQQPVSAAQPGDRPVKREPVRPDDTIVAVSTPTGSAVRAIVRLSGPDGLEAVATVFRACQSTPLEQRVNYSVTAGYLNVEGFPKDIPGVLYVMRAPRSYTRQDVAELHIPGSPPLVQAVMEVLTAGSVRLARAGEFTERAYLSGRIDLAQAEAVLKVISAASREELTASVRELDGSLSRELQKLEHRLFDLLVQLEAALDFSEQEIEILSIAEVERILTEIGDDLEALERGAEGAYVFAERPRVLISGRPNVGKSSLYNRLVGSSEAIVSRTPGTTRDVLECELSVNGVELSLIDVAGVGEASEEIEAAAQERAQRELFKADLVLHVVDATNEPQTNADAPGRHGPCVLVLNKIDLVEDGWKPAVAADSSVLEVLAVSALTGQGCDELKRRLTALVSTVVGGSAKGYLLNLRQRSGISLAREAVQRVRAILAEGLAWEFAALDVRQALSALSDLTGPLDEESVLGRIFAEFCVGK